MTAIVRKSWNGWYWLHLKLSYKTNRWQGPYPTKEAAEEAAEG